MALNPQKFHAFGSLLRNKLHHNSLIFRHLTFGCAQHDVT